MKIFVLLAFVFLSAAANAQDTIPLPDSSALLPVPVIMKKDAVTIQSILDSNHLINSKAKPVYFIQKERKYFSNEFMFYLIIGVFFSFGILKLIFNRYISIVFRVFFNTSLRQSQLTDQLLQAKLPSMFFNIFFCIMGGIYSYLLLIFYNVLPEQGEIKYLWVMIAVLAVVYFFKYLVLKFTGWVSGYTQEAGTYIFIVFLINKILAISLMPVVLVIAFAEKQVAQIAVILSFSVLVLLFLLRYLRAYSLLQNKLSIRKFHFFIYIICVEIIPLLLIYKVAERLLTNYA